MCRGVRYVCAIQGENFLHKTKNTKGTAVMSGSTRVAASCSLDSLTNAHDGSETVSAGRRAGDSACSIPPQTIAQECLDVIRDWTPKLAKALKVVGLINIQYCVQDNNVRALADMPFFYIPRFACFQASGAR